MRLTLDYTGWGRGSPKSRVIAVIAEIEDLLWMSLKIVDFGVDLAFKQIALQITAIPAITRSSVAAAQDIPQQNIRPGAEGNYHAGAPATGARHNRIPGGRIPRVRARIRSRSAEQSGRLHLLPRQNGSRRRNGRPACGSIPGHSQDYRIHAARFLSGWSLLRRHGMFQRSRRLAAAGPGKAIQGRLFRSERSRDKPQQANASPIL